MLTQIGVIIGILWWGAFGWLDDNNLCVLVGILFGSIVGLNIRYYVSICGLLGLIWGFWFNDGIMRNGISILMLHGMIVRGASFMLYDLLIEKCKNDVDPPVYGALWV